MNKLENQSILPTNGNKLKSAVLATALALGLVILPGVSNGANLDSNLDLSVESNDDRCVIIIVPKPLPPIPPIIIIDPRK